MMTLYMILLKVLVEKETDIKGCFKREFASHSNITMSVIFDVVSFVISKVAPYFVHISALSICSFTLIFFHSERQM